MVNSYNTVYTGTVYMGYYYTAMNSVVFDTGSSFLVLNTIDCTNCDLTYDYTTSQTKGYYKNLGVAMR